MTSPLDRTLESIIGALRQHVLPQLADDFARGQAFGVIYMLQQLGLQLDWAVPPLVAMLQRQAEAAATLGALCAGTDAPAPPSVALPAACVSGSQLLALRDAFDQWLADLFDWLETARGSLPAERVRAIDLAARACARDVNEIESRQTPRPMFAQIASGRETP